MIETARKTTHPIEDLFLNRWSPRAFEATPMPHEHLMAILEAARWAPSTYNIQPWRFLFSHREDEHWDLYLSLLDDFNRAWAQNASALIFLFSDSMTPERDGRPAKPARNHSFDAGAAWAQLALQSTALGYQAHAMAGVHYDQLHSALKMPENYKAEIAVAIGKQTAPNNLPEALREREVPSGRLPLSAIASAGVFEA